MVGKTRPEGVSIYGAAAGRIGMKPGHIPHDLFRDLVGEFTNACASEFLNHPGFGRIIVTSQAEGFTISIHQYVRAHNPLIRQF